MNAAAWIRQQLDRPTGESERRAASTTITVGVIAAALLLAMTSTGVPATKPSRGSHQATSTVSTTAAGAPPADALRTAQRFLDGYLAFAYGHGPARAVKYTTRSFAAALAKRAGTIPPALRALHPRVLTLHATSSSDGAVVVTSLVKDGEVVAYPIRVLLALRGGRYFVTGLRGA